MKWTPDTPSEDGLYLFVGRISHHSYTMVWINPTPVRWYTNPKHWKVPAGIVATLDENYERSSCYLFEDDIVEGWWHGPIGCTGVPQIKKASWKAEELGCDHRERR
ncbi:MAG: hypothetical protein ACXABY_07200 [Candidatus Thorarchaeota archaeon]|jgi:hypothetical protein